MRQPSLRVGVPWCYHSRATIAMGQRWSIRFRQSNYFVQVSEQIFLINNVKVFMTLFFYFLTIFNFFGWFSFFIHINENNTKLCSHTKITNRDIKVAKLQWDQSLMSRYLPHFYRVLDENGRTRLRWQNDLDNYIN